MIRLLFWIALIAAAFWLWRKFKSPAASPRDNTLDSPLKMVRCAQCGVHLPKDRALPRGSQWYCSQAHLEQGPGDRQP
ncbi:PP0621 family protein [Pseudomonas sp. LS1212]|uniref:PP0621 family protein n=1 Tax=Pseudomonas sp. LS1212 TaxID=2972478 RepID=UPI00215CC923|nr:PP0621 family protein [Pseudomonas sp. LS1212]UVJ43351.1 PP0621 family protein [Pseudomonas sp. LS1212]